MKFLQVFKCFHEFLSVPIQFLVLAIDDVFIKSSFQYGLDRICRACDLLAALPLGDVAPKVTLRLFLSVLRLLN